MVGIVNSERIKDMEQRKYRVYDQFGHRRLLLPKDEAEETAHNFSTNHGIKLGINRNDLIPDPENPGEESLVVSPDVLARLLHNGSASEEDLKYIQERLSDTAHRASGFMLTVNADETTVDSEEKNTNAFSETTIAPTVTDTSQAQVTIPPVTNPAYAETGVMPVLEPNAVEKTYIMPITVDPVEVNGWINFLTAFHNNPEITQYEENPFKPLIDVLEDPNKVQLHGNLVKALKILFEASIINKKKYYDGAEDTVDFWCPLKDDSPEYAFVKSVLLAIDENADPPVSDRQDYQYDDYINNISDCFSNSSMFFKETISPEMKGFLEKERRIIPVPERLREEFHSKLATQLWE